MQQQFAEPEDYERAVACTLEQFGALHYAVNNAGVSGNFIPLTEMTPEQWRQIVDIDLNSLFYGLKYEILAILDAGGGAIVTSPASSPTAAARPPSTPAPSTASVA